MRVCMLFLKIYVTFVRREQKRMNKRENNILKSASNLNGNLNCSKELEHYAS